MTDIRGQTLGNRYHVVEFLGRGGMAEVYKVWDSTKAVHLAIKVLREDLAQDKIFLRRFQREADTLEKLQHPHIVRIYGLERAGDLSFIVMDFVDGTSLRKVIFDSEGGLPEESVLHIAQAICSALHFAHQEGMVHCDLKPGNVMIHENGTVLVTDFGIARMSDAATATMVGMGTPAYMSPEQVQGLDPTPETDIYAMGIVLFEMLTGGERPFIGENAKITGTVGDKVRWEQVNQNPPSPRKYNSGISKEMAAVVLKCLAKDPKDRFSSGLELLNALGQASSTSEVDVVPKPEETHYPSQTPSSEYAKDEEKSTSSQKSSRRLISDRGRNFWRWFFVVGIVGIGLLVFGIWVINKNKLEPRVVVETVVIEQTSTPVKLVMEITATPTPNLPTPIGQLAFASNREGNWEIYVINADGSKISNLTNSPADDDEPAWSPDGMQIVFSTGYTVPYDENGIRTINRMNMNGTSFYEVLECGNLNAKCNPLWSEDNSYIRFRRQGLGSWQTDIHGNINSELTSLYAVTGHSPDGKKYIRESYQNGNWEIVVSYVDGSETINLTNHPASDRDPAWSPDGEFIAFVSDRDGNLEVYLMRSDGTGLTNLTNNSADDQSPDWKPVGISDVSPQTRIDPIEDRATAVLSAIDDRVPDREYNFDNGARPWEAHGGSQRPGFTYSDGVYQYVHRVSGEYQWERGPSFSTNHVLEFDLKFYPYESSWTAFASEILSYDSCRIYWDINQREMRIEDNTFQHSEIVPVLLWPHSSWHKITIISLDAEITVLVDDQVVNSAECEFLNFSSFGSINFSGHNAVKIEIDNVKLWDISDLKGQFPMP